MLELNNSDPNGYIGEFALRGTQFINEMKASGNGFVSTVGSVLNVLNPNNLEMLAADGGKLKGYLDFDNETFVITSATDGDCNDIPSDRSEVSGEYTFTTLSGHESMAYILRMLGGEFEQESYPNCINFQTRCTGVSGGDLACYTFCIQWN